MISQRRSLRKSDHEDRFADEEDLFSQDLLPAADLPFVREDLTFPPDDPW